MPDVLYRQAKLCDVAAMACIRAAERESEEYWRLRISAYLEGRHHPRLARASRVLYVASQSDTLVGFIAGHLTRRYACDGELQWIDVIGEHRRSGIASQLVRHLAAWFVQWGALRICVDVQPANNVARAFYARHGAETLNRHWVWNDIHVVLGQQNL